MSCEADSEKLAALAAGDLDEADAAALRRHVEECPSCRRRLAAIEKVDRALPSLRPDSPPAEAVWRARRALSDAIRPESAPEIMTLDEAAVLLRLTPAQLGEIAEELPAFEIAGQVRIRREKLLEWIERRESDHERQVIESRIARGRVIRLDKGVA